MERLPSRPGANPRRYPATRARVLCVCVCLDPSCEACQGDLPDHHQVCPSGPGCFGKPLYTEVGWLHSAQLATTQWTKPWPARPTRLPPMRASTRTHEHILSFKHECLVCVHVLSGCIRACIHACGYLCQRPPTRILTSTDNAQASE